MVYNGMPSGLNNAIWDPHFSLPIVASTLREVEGGTSFGGGLGILENRYGMVRSNGKFGHGINFSNHRRLRRKFR